MKLQENNIPHWLPQPITAIRLNKKRERNLTDGE